MKANTTPTLSTITIESRSNDEIYDWLKANGAEEYFGEGIPWPEDYELDSEDYRESREQLEGWVNEIMEKLEVAS